VLHLSYWDHRSNAQIAQAIGVPIGTMEGHIA
jgi:DNA-directed RNA polymerase specialized sigma24 family protein